MGLNAIETLESRQMLSGVAAHVVGSTLKITGTPRNDAIVVSLKGNTLAVRANGITRNFPSKGVKLIDLRGGRGKDKLRVDAPIAYKINRGPTVIPVLLPVQLSALFSSSKCMIQTGAATLNVGTTGSTASAVVNHGFGAGARSVLVTGLSPVTLSSLPTLNPFMGGGSTLPIRLSADASLMLRCNAGELNLVVETLSAGQTPQITFFGSETTWNDSTLHLAVSPAAAITPGTYPLIRFADTAYLPADLGHTSFKSENLPAQFTYDLVLNAANRTIDLVIADQPAAEPAAIDQPA